MPRPSLSRRDFLQAAVAAGTCVPFAASAFKPRQVRAADGKKARGPNDKLKIGCVGTMGKAASNIAPVQDAGAEISVLCDIDANRLAMAAKLYPHAKQHADFRRIFDHDLDAVIVSTPDHMHAFPVVEALRRGLHVYCEKPLTHSIHEARLISDLTKSSGVVTQMGNQIHAGSNYRRVVEIIQGGVIGEVKRVFVWQGGGVRAGKRVKEAKVPEGIAYDLWLGPAPYRPFDESHFHFNWRYWWDFGGGQLADFWCHYSDLPFWALGLTYPTSIEAKGEKGHDGDNECPNAMQVDYQYPARGSAPPVHLTWYHGGWKPEGAEKYGLSSAVLFEGESGRLLADYGTHKLFMDDGKEARAVKPSIPDSIGHHKEWVEAILGNGKTTCPFTYGAMLTESAHLGNVSYRTGKRIEWDATKGEAIGCPEAAAIVKRDYRAGWTL
jgi:predicted dehydrogenase